MQSAMATMVVQPYFLPGFVGEGADEGTLTFGEGADQVVLSFPALTPAALEALCQRLCKAQEEYLARRPIADIVGIIDRVVQHWLDPHYPYRQQAEALLPTITRYSA